MKTKEPNSNTTAPATNPYRSRRLKILGLDSDRLIRTFFGGNAFIAVVILALIIIFLFRESFGFFGQNRERLETYRATGVEYSDMMIEQVDEFYALTRYLTFIKTQQLDHLQRVEGLSHEEAEARMEPLQVYTEAFREAILPLQSISDELKNRTRKLRDSYESNLSNQKTRTAYLAEAAILRSSGNDEAALAKEAAANAVSLKVINLEAARTAMKAEYPRYLNASNQMQEHVLRMSQELPPLISPTGRTQALKFRDLARAFSADAEVRETEIRDWEADREVPFYAAFTTFIFGTEWITNSFIQDWYGIIPLFTGSLLVSGIALLFAVPLGVAGALYTSQVASPREQQLIKPYIEFISAIPSVVIGFFGVLVWGEFVREASNWSIFSWLPFFPISERLNAFTAGCLLALMAIPTIFTLAEDALNNVPKAFKEASLAVGATRLQTTVRIILPTALSGIISAVLLGFGRVIGETMVVLLCAGNRIAIPDFSDGLGVIFEPVHTMTGVVAQEMGEVVPGSTHYRALFLVGTFLFFVSLLINYVAQKIVLRYRISAN